MSSSPPVKLEIAKEIMLKAMETMKHNFGTDISAEEFNQRYAQELDQLFKSIYQTISDVDAGSTPKVKTHQL